MGEIKLANAEDIPRLIPVLRELRPHLSESDLTGLLPQLFLEGYKIAYLGDSSSAYSIIGFRIITFLYSGKTLYIDDLSTLAQFQKLGHAGKLFEWVKTYAKDNNCAHLSLDSGFQRRDAYRFYLNQGLYVESLHFGRKVEEL